MLKKIRLIIAALILSGFVVLFIGIRYLPDIAWLSFLSDVQAAPAMASLNVVALVVLCMATLLFGRVYCSVLCPLGIFQDIVARLRPRKKKPYAYWQNGRAIRVAKHVIAISWILSLFLGIGVIWSALDPYSIFARALAHNIAPAFDALIPTPDYAFNNDLWLQSSSAVAVFFAAACFLTIALVAFFTGRGYCTTVCPVGTILGYLGRFSLFGIRIDERKCRHCNRCSHRCKSHCLNTEKHVQEESVAKIMVDMSRCVACMNCLGSCKFGALHYGLRIKDKTPRTPIEGELSPNPQRKPPEKDMTAPDNAIKATTVSFQHQEGGRHPKDDAQWSKKEVDDEKRQSIKAAMAGVLGGFSAFYATPGLAAPSKTRSKKAAVARKLAPPRKHAVFPPSADDINAFMKRCTGCGLCVRACLNNVIYFPMPANVHAFQPRMRFEYGSCRPTCNACTRICPTAALRKLAISEKPRHPIGRAVVEPSRCINHTTPSAQCSACRRMCPYGAIVTIPSTRSNGSPCTIPTVDGDKCVGCGTCEYVCAARPIAAIHVEGPVAHQRHIS